MAVITAEIRPPEGALEVMTRLGDVKTALAYIKPGDDAGWTVRCTSEIIRALNLDRPEEKLLAFRLLNEALTQIGDDEEAHWLLAKLLEACPLKGDTKMAEFLVQASEVFNRTRKYWATGRALCELARLWTHFSTENREELFPFAQRGILRFTRASKSLELSRLFEYWAGYDARAAATALDEQLNLNQHVSNRAIVLVARAAEAAGESGRLQAARDKILRDVAAGSKDPFRRANILTELASLELELGYRNEAGETIRLALSAIAQIGGSEDPNWKIEVVGSERAENASRPADAKTARINAAAMHVRLDASAGRMTLVDAWTSMHGSGPWHTEDLTILVKTQLASNPKALAPLIRATPSALMRSGLLIAAAMEHLSDNPDEAKRELSQALRLHKIDYPEHKVD